MFESFQEHYAASPALTIGATIAAALAALTALKAWFNIGPGGNPVEIKNWIMTLFHQVEDNIPVPPVIKPVIDATVEQLVDALITLLLNAGMKADQIASMKLVDAAPEAAKAATARALDRLAAESLRAKSV
jgi:hypothetical protein